MVKRVSDKCWRRDYSRYMYKELMKQDWVTRHVSLGNLMYNDRAMYCMMLQERLSSAEALQGKCKERKWTWCLFRKSHRDQFSYLPLCVWITTGAPRKQPRPHFMFTLVINYVVIIASTPLTVPKCSPRSVKMKSGRGCSRGVPLLTHSGQV